MNKNWKGWEVEVEKITTEEDMKEACIWTLNDHPEKTTMTLQQIYKCLHSPARTQWFKIRMKNIPTSVSVHLVRHNIGGTLHYVKTNRPDRGSKSTVSDRNTPVNHMIWCNAEELINIAHKRLCFKSEGPTIDVMRLIVGEIANVDPDLYPHLVPMCVYLQRCPELRTCGFFQEMVE